METAWIEYELEKASVVHEVTLKLNNFRSKIYYLKITVDGKEIFNGATEKSLGYCTIICTPAKGKKVRIQLQQPSISIANNGVEVNGKKLDDGVTRNDADAKGTLSIIEAEIYESLK